MFETNQINPLTATLFHWNFHSLEVVSRLRDPQLQVSGNYSDLAKWRSTFFDLVDLMSHFILTHLNCDNKKNKKTNIFGNGGQRVEYMKVRGPDVRKVKLHCVM